MLELRTGEARTVLVPFTSACVPEVDLNTGRVVVDIPPGLAEDGGDAENAADSGGRKSKDGRKDGKESP